MLKLLSDANAVLNVDNFYIVEKASGLDELIFDMSIYDENYPYVLEEAIIEYEQPYLIKAIDAGKELAKVKCQLNLDALKSTLLIGYNNNSATLQQTVDGVLPSDWMFLDNSGSIIRRTIEGNYTPLEFIFHFTQPVPINMMWWLFMGWFSALMYRRKLLGRIHYHHLNRLEPLHPES